MENRKHSSSYARDRAMDQAVSRGPLIAEDRVRSHASPLHVRRQTIRHYRLLARLSAAPSDRWRKRINQGVKYAGAERYCKNFPAVADEESVFRHQQCLTLVKTRPFAGPNPRSPSDTVITIIPDRNNSFQKTMTLRETKLPRTAILLNDTTTTAGQILVFHVGAKER